MFAVLVPIVFSLLFLLTYPRISSLSPATRPDLFPAQAVYVFGGFGWFVTFLACLSAFRQTRYEPVVVTSFVLFLLFGLELYLAGLSLYSR